LRVQNGGTVVIGGILTESSQKNRVSVPWLASLPVVGRLFRSSAEQADKTELLIFVTPRIVEQAPLPEVSAGERPDTAAL
jgi:type IV pilus assembly protein PilQ